MCKVLSFNPDCKYNSRKGTKVRELAERQRRVVVPYEEIRGYKWNLAKGFWTPKSKKGAK